MAVMIGPVPIVITNDFAATFDASAQIEGSIGTTLAVGAKRSVGFEYDSRTGKISEINEREYIGDGYKWETAVKASGEAKMGVYAHLITKLYGSTGADLAVGIMGSVEGELYAGINTDNDVECYGKLGIQIGPEAKGSLVVSIPIIDKELANSPLFTVTLPLWVDEKWEKNIAPETIKPNDEPADTKPNDELTENITSNNVSSEPTSANPTTSNPSSETVSGPVQVGDSIFFGKYEQDNNRSNGKEDIEWQVLDIKDGKAFVISVYALDCQQYNTSRTDVTWETCTLRSWLNNDFINEAFNDAEKANIPTVTVPAHKNPFIADIIAKDPGNDTQDKVFLLSLVEADMYFNSKDELRCKATEYAASNEEYDGSLPKGNCWWWSRTIGTDERQFAFFMHSGTVYQMGHTIVYYLAVRPAMWIELDAI